LSNELSGSAGVGCQYEHWTGSFCGDDVDMQPTEDILNVDNEAWWVIQIDVYVNGGVTTIEGHAVPASMGHDQIVDTIAQSGKLEVTLVSRMEFEPHNYINTNPQSPLLGYVIGVEELIVNGFKRGHLRMRRRIEGLDDNVSLVLVGSIVAED